MTDTATNQAAPPAGPPDADLMSEEGSRPRRIIPKKVTKRQPAKTVAHIPNQNRVNRTYDWPAIREAYVEGVPLDDDSGDRVWPTLDEVAKQFDRPAVRIREKAAEERWTAQRSSYQQQIAQQRQADRAKQISGQMLDLDTRALDAGKLGLQLTMIRMTEVAKASALHKAHREEMERQAAAGFPVDWGAKENRSPIYHMELVSLSKAAQQFHDLGLKALGQDVTRHQLTVTGADGGPIEVGVDVRGELLREDPDRLGKFFQAAEAAGLFTAFLDDDTVDADVVDEDEEQLAIEGEQA